MKHLRCNEERAVWRCASTGVWEPGLRDHAEGCPVCRDVALVTASLAGLSTEPTPLPDAHLLWWRERWLRSREAERALRPVVLFQRFAYAVLAIAAVAGLAYLPLLAGWLPVPQGNVTLLRWTVPVLPLACAVLAAAGVSVLLALRAACSEE